MGNAVTAVNNLVLFHLESNDRQHIYRRHIFFLADSAKGVSLIWKHQQQQQQ